MEENGGAGGGWCDTPSILIIENRSATDRRNHFLKRIRLN